MLWNSAPGKTHQVSLGLEYALIDLADSTYFGSFGDPLNPTTVTEAAPRDRREADITKNLVGMVRDFLPEIRIAALQSLDTLGDYAVAPSIMDALRDPDERVRLQALKTLNSLQEKKAAAIEAERKRQEELRRQAAAQKGQ